MGTMLSLKELNTTHGRQMASLQILLMIFVLFSNGVLTYEVDGIEKELLDVIVKDKKLKEDGYSEFELANINEINIHGFLERSSSDSIRRRKRSLMSEDISLNLTFSAFHETFKMAVKYNTELFPPDMSVVFYEDGNPHVYKGNIPDCLLEGRTEDNGVVALTYCDGISGSVMQGEYLYRLDPIGQMGNHFNETILVSRTVRKHDTLNNDYMNQINNEIFSKNNLTQPLDRASTSRHKRQTYTSYFIEVGIYLDEIFYQLLEDKGRTDRPAKIQWVVTKWNMAQAMLNIPEELGYKIVLQIKGIEFWKTNPAWFTFVETDTSATLNNFWNGIQTQNPLNFDHFHIHTGTNGQGQGLSGIPAVCVNTKRAAMSADPDGYDGYIQAHETGHALNMRHDPDIPCTVDPVDGLMAITGYDRLGWSSCSKAALEQLITKKAVADCLNFVNVPASAVPADIAGITVKGLWPGMAMSPDELCVHENGPGWQYRPYFMNVADCGIRSCVNANEGIYYGTMKNMQAKYGSYCGEGMVCNPRMQPKCIPLAETKIPADTYSVIHGGWSEWGPVGGCSRSCGTGLMVKARNCTNPTPLNTGSCVGSYYHGEICNTDPCPSDPTTKNQLIKARAGETCQRLIDDNVIPAAEFTGAGAVKGTGTGVGRCEVKCTNKAGFSSPSQTRWAFMPDGTPCTHDTVTFSDRESLGYIRGRGYQVNCMRGYCELFGCDKLSGVKALDLCGVCGGDTSTCLPVDKQYCEPLAQDQRVSVVTIPAGSTQLLFYFTHSKMKKWFVELWNTADEPVMVSKIDGITNTGDSPVNKAGTDWHFWSSKQYLWALGPTDQDLVLKIFNSAGQGSNNCVHVGFSMPPATTMPVFAAGTQDDPQPDPATLPVAPTNAPTTTSSTTTTDAGTTTTASATTSGSTTTAGPTPTSGPATTSPASTSAGPSTTAPPGTTAGPTPTVTVRPDRCPSGSFYCASNDQCFGYTDLCNGKNECTDKSDEVNVFCKTKSTASSYHAHPLVAMVLLLIHACIRRLQ